MSTRDGSDRLATLRSVPPLPTGNGSSSVASDPPTASSGEVAYTIADPYHAHSHHHHHAHASRAGSGGRGAGELGGVSGLVWINSIAIGVLFVFLFIYALSHNVDSSPPAVLDATLGGSDGGEVDPPPFPSPPPSHRRPPADEADSLRPPPPPPPQTHVAGAHEFLFHYSSGHPLTLEAGPAVADDDAHAPPRRARTFYLVESGGASPDGAREMGALRPEDLASYQCCCYDKHVSVCQSAAPELLPGYELACLLLYDDGADAALADDGEAWTLVVTLGREFAPRHTYCRLGVQPLPARHRPDGRVRDRLYPDRSRERRALAPQPDEDPVQE